MDDTFSGLSKSTLSLSSPVAASTIDHVKARSAGFDSGDGINSTVTRSAASMAASMD